MVVRVDSGAVIQATVRREEPAVWYANPVRSDPLHKDLAGLIPWLDRRGVAYCGFDRKAFRVELLAAAAATIGYGVFLLARGNGWAVPVALVGLLVLVMGIVFARTRRCVVEVDFDQSEFRLRHFVYPVGFWDIRRKNLVVVKFSEIRGVSIHHTKRGKEAFVGTSRSRFLLNHDIEHFDRIVQLLEELAGPDGNTKMVRSTRVWMLVSALIGAGGFCLVAWIAWRIGWI
jgi:hypothetical protein